MKKWISLIALLATCVCCAGALAEMGTRLSPDAAKAFADPRWEGYQPAVVSGYGDQDSQTGQYAVLMKKGEHNVLCMVEKEAGQTEFAITVENDKAVYQGDLLPRLLIDTAGDALFMSYHDAAGEILGAQFSVFKQNGQWRSVGAVFFLPPQDGRYPEVMVGAQEGRLSYRMLWTDENDNILEHGEEFFLTKDAEAYQLARFDIGRCMEDYEQLCTISLTSGSTDTPYQFYDRLEKLPKPIQALLPTGAMKFIYAGRQDDRLCVTLEEESGVRRAWIFGLEDGVYQLECESAPMPRLDGAAAIFDLHDKDTLYVIYEYDPFVENAPPSWLVAFTRYDSGTWVFSLMTIPL